MSGALSGMQFVPHSTPGEAMEEGQHRKPTFKGVRGAGVGGAEFQGTRTIAPIAKGAFSSQEQALAFRHQGGALSQGKANIGSWLFKPE